MFLDLSLLARAMRELEERKSTLGAKPMTRMCNLIWLSAQWARFAHGSLLIVVRNSYFSRSLNERRNHAESKK